jgi:FtsP/CotA-like multicopper oxidase with cupredoxin domain
VTRAPGVVKVKVPFTNPLVVGKFPFRCHILEHEDGGMMANVRVRAR